ncbi:MAG: class I SAM-dependent methyltransferase [Actinomycetota bacterium]|nr:class I SAM-dependent methyltransferase [Actinomycetota bacterium]
MDARLRQAARAAVGFLPENEGLALYRAGLTGAEAGPLLEIGSYCGKSAIYLGAAARERGTVLYSIDHHRGSEEHQVGEEYHDPGLVDPDTGTIDSFPQFRATIAAAGLDEVVVPIVAASAVAARGWATPLGLLFVDGGHSEAAARTDYESWSHHVVAGGILAVHDVFEDPADGGRAPFMIYRAALRSGCFEEIAVEDSLRVLQRVDQARV